MSALAAPMMRLYIVEKCVKFGAVKLAFHGADTDFHTDTDIGMCSATFLFRKLPQE